MEKKFLVANLQVLNGKLFFWALKIEDNFYFGKKIEEFLKKIEDNSEQDINCYLWKGNKIAINLLIKHCCFFSKTYNYVVEKHANKYNDFTFLQNSKNINYFLEIQKNINIRFICIENISPNFSEEVRISDFEWQEQKNKNQEFKITKDDINFSKNKLNLMNSIISRKLELAKTKIHRLSISNNVYNLWRLRYFPKKKYKLFFEDWVESEDEYKWYRKFIEGGFNFFNSKYENQTLELDIRDASGHYPRIILENILPVKKSANCLELGKFCFHKLKIYEIWIASAKLKPNRFPFVKINSFDNEKEIPKEFSNVTIYKTNIEWNFILEHYDINFFTIIREKCFSSYHGEKIAGKFLREFLDLKNNATSYDDRLAVKSYTTIWWGVFITNAIRDRKFLVRKKILNNQNYYFETEENDFFAWETKTEFSNQPKYCPLGIFVASYARIEILKTALANYERLVYIGIDSIFLLKSEKNYWPKFSGIGEFKKIYGEERTFVTIRDNMRYLVENEKNQVLNLKFSGIDKNKISVDDFKKGEKKFFKSKKSIKKTSTGDILLIEEDINFKK